MKKYLSLFGTSFKQEITFKFDLVIKLFSAVVIFIILYAFWTELYSVLNTNIISGYTIFEMVVYVWLMSCIRELTFFRPKIGSSIQNGELVAIMIKPVNILFFYFLRDVSSGIFRFIYSFIVFLILCFSLGLFIQTNPINIVLFLVSLVFAVIIINLIRTTVSIFAFWIGSSWGLMNLIWPLEWIFSGALFPLTFLPLFIQDIFKLLPFSYSFYVPGAIYLGKFTLNEILFNIGIQILWVVVLAVILFLLWNKGIKDYESYGG